MYTKAFKIRNLSKLYEEVHNAKYYIYNQCVPLGYLQLIQKSNDLSELNNEYLAIVIQKNEYLKQLSDDFFEISKIQNGNEELTTESVNFSNLVSETILEQYTWIDEREITPSFDISDSVIINSDLHSLKRILDNLFSNAEKYTKSVFGLTLKKQMDTVTLYI